VGGTKKVRVAVRIVTADPNQDSHPGADKRFREDLYYRLNAITIQVPSAPGKGPRRAVSWPAILVVLTRRRRTTATARRLPPTRTWGCIEAYSWPGNVARARERGSSAAVVLAGALRVRSANLPDAVRERFWSCCCETGPPRTRIPHEHNGVGCVQGPDRHTPLAEGRGAAVEGRPSTTHGNKGPTAQDARQRSEDPVFRKSSRARPTPRPGRRAPAPADRGGLRDHPIRGRRRRRHPSRFRAPHTDKLNSAQLPHARRAARGPDRPTPTEAVRVLIVTGAGTALLRRARSLGAAPDIRQAGWRRKRRGARRA